MSGTRRREFITLLGGAAATWPLAARGQQSGKVWRIGILSGVSRPAALPAIWGGFLQGMRQLGYVEGEHFVTEYRFADGKPERFPQLAAELVQLKSDVIVVGASNGIRAVQEATTTIPIVMAYSIDPVGNGLAASLARPGGNTTGLASAQEDTVSKQVELLAMAVPGLSRLAIMTNPNARNHGPLLQAAKTAAAKAAVTLVPVAAATLQEIERAFELMTKEDIRATVFLPDPFLLLSRQRIAELAIRNRLPSIFAHRDYVEVGGLMSYGESFGDFGRRAANFVDKVFKGIKPAELPIEQPTRFFLVLNLKTAKTIGLDVPDKLLALADEVIE
jgi:putative ABC transport system substrate-binding protein